MEINYHKFYSNHLKEQFEIKVFGKYGKPILVFPSSCGRFYDFENFGMIHEIKEYIKAGDIFVVCVDGRDSETWYNPQKDENMGKRHRQYELAICEDVKQFLYDVYKVRERFLATGVSGGAYHSLNFNLKFPEVFDSSISLSGVYSLKHMVGDYFDLSIYYNDILMYLSNLEDPSLLNQIRQSYFIICHGQGAYEDFQDEARAVAMMLHAKNITCWYDVWGKEYSHDWPSWKAQLSKFLYALKSGVIFPNIDHKLVKFIGPQRRILPLK